MDRSNQILCERRADGVSFQSFGREVRLVVMPGRDSATVLNALKERYPANQRWRHLKNAVVRRLRSGELARRLWVDLAPEYAITPKKEERGRYVPVGNNL